MNERPLLPTEIAVVPWGTVAVMSALVFGLYFVYDLVGPAAPGIIANTSHSRIGILNGLVFLPGIVTAVTAGVMLDRFGVKPVGLVVVLLFGGGAVMSAYAGRPDGSAFLLARVLLGLSMEPGMVVAATAILRGVPTRRLGLTLSLLAAAGRLGSYAADEAPIWVPWMRLPHSATETSAYTYWLVAGIVSSVVMVAVGAYLSLMPSGATTPVARNNPPDEIGTLWELPVGFWLLTAVCVATYAPVFVFRTFGQEALVGQGWTKAEASKLIGLTSLIPLFLSPCFGWLSDQRRRRAPMMLGGTMLLTLGFVLVAQRPAPWYGQVAILGVAFAILPTAIWPAIRDEVKKSQAGIASGTMTSFQNAGLFALHLVVGLTIDGRGTTAEAQGHEVGNLILLMVTITGLVAACLYYWLVVVSRKGPAKSQALLST